MQTKNFRQRSTRDKPTTTSAAHDNSFRSKGHDNSFRRKGDESGDKWARRKKMIMAKRGLKSLSVALSLPLILTLTNICMFGANDNYKMSNRPNWVPPTWALHMACLGSSLLLGLCGWIVWADGGFHKNPNALGLYVGQFGLSLLWDPLVFKMGLNWAGLIVAAGVCCALFRCYRLFKEVNEIAADLVLPCLGWACFLAFVSFKLLLT